MAVPLVGPAGLVGSVSVDFLVVKPFESVPNTYVEGGAPAWRPIKLIGHRGTGADKYCKEDAHHIPENTIASFTEAFKSVGMVEFDVHVMRDGVPVIYHDFRLGQQAFQAITTDLTVDLLKQYNEQFHKAAPLPTFERLFLVRQKQYTLFLSFVPNNICCRSSTHRSPSTLRSSTRTRARWRSRTSRRSAT